MEERERRRRRGSWAAGDAAPCLAFSLACLLCFLAAIATRPCSESGDHTRS